MLIVGAIIMTDREIGLMTIRQRNEWEAWRRLCRVLLENDVVTTLDLRAPTTSERETKGEIILRHIREWGELRAALEGGIAMTDEELNDLLKDSRDETQLPDGISICASCGNETDVYGCGGEFCGVTGDNLTIERK